jgi:predicted acetyltransferase
LQPSKSVEIPRFERAREADMDELLRIHTSAFPDPRGRDARVANFVENPLGGFDRLFVLRAGDGRPVAHAFLFELAVSLAGTFVRFGGVASVGVAPEHRGRGLARALLGFLHAEAAREGLAGTFLYAFRQGFYSRFGYGRTGLDVIVDAHPASFPASANAARVRPARAEDHAAIEALHTVSRLTGTLGHRRPARVWERLRAREGREWVVAELDGRVTGYMWADRGCAEAHAPIALAIGDLVASEQESEDALFAWVASQRDQVQRVVWQLPAHMLGRLDLVDPDRHRAGTDAIEHPLGTVALGPMVRLGDDVAAFLRARAWPVDGLVRVALVDEGGKRIEAFRIRSSRSDVEVDALGASEEAHIEATRGDLASLLAGGVALRDLPRIRWNRRGTDSAAVDLEAFFALPPTHVTDAF